MIMESRACGSQRTGRREGQKVLVTSSLRMLKVQRTRLKRQRELRSMAGQYGSTFRSRATDQVVVEAEMTAADAVSSPEGEDGEAIAVGVADEVAIAVDEVAGEADEVGMYAMEALPRMRAGKPHSDVSRFLCLFCSWLFKKYRIQ